MKAWLIDLDGTLVDTLGDFEAALAPVAARCGTPAPDAALLRQLVGRGAERLIRDLLARWGRDESDFDSAWALYQQQYAAVNGRHARVFDGVREGLAQLAPAPLACVTNKPQANAEALLRQLGLRDAFAVVVGARPGLRAKPAPDALQAACAELGLAPAACGMVGDSRNDAEAARAAGCGAVLLLRHGYNHGEAVDAVPADGHLDRLSEIGRWISDRRPAAPS